MANRQERALQNLLNTDETRSDYPDTLSLPNTVHSAVLVAVEKTQRDKRERSMHFRYRRNTWLGGIAFRGPTSEHSVSSLHLKFAELYPPDIHFHTHPALDVESFQQDVMRNATKQGVKINERTRDRMAAMSMDAHMLTTRLPSAPDMYSSMLRPLGNLAHLVASDHGSFLWVRRELSRQSKNDHEEWRRFADDVEERTGEADKVKISLAEVDQAGFALSLQRMVDTRVRTLDPMYVCYASSRLDSPEMQRLGLISGANSDNS